jgi:hypothetical protein
MGLYDRSRQCSPYYGNSDGVCLSNGETVVLCDVRAETEEKIDNSKITSGHDPL